MCSSITSIIMVQKYIIKKKKTWSKVNLYKDKKTEYLFSPAYLNIKHNVYFLCEHKYLRVYVRANNNYKNVYHVRLSFRKKIKQKSTKQKQKQIKKKKMDIKIKTISTVQLLLLLLFCFNV